MKKNYLLIVTCLCASLFLFSCDDKLDESGGFISNAVYPVDLSLLPVWYDDDHCYVYVNLDGEIVLEDDYKEATRFFDGIAVVSQSNSDLDYYYINKKGEQIGNDEYYDAKEFFNGFAAVKKNSNSDYHFIDKNGNDAIDGHYAEVSDFNDGLVAVKDESYTVNRIYNSQNSTYDYEYDFYYYINKEGEEVIDNEDYVVANTFYDGAAVVAVADFIDKTRYEKKYGLIDKKGEVLVDFDYDAAEAYCTEGLLGVSENNKWGFVNKEGREVVDFDYKDVHPFMEGYAAVEEDYNEWYFIDKKGNKVDMPFEFQNVSWGFSEGLAAVMYNGKWGYINKSGEFVIEPQFTGMPRPFINGYAELGNNRGIIDKKGVVLFSSSSPIVEKSVSVGEKTPDIVDLKRVLFK